jgi:Raf kinase inhibitor-like YbhB/YbcL family protein
MRTWVHWVAFGIPAASSSLPGGVPPGAAIAAGGTQGKNSWGNLGYGGPCPPSGTHRYFFKLYALDTLLGDLHEPTKAMLLKAMEGHVLGQAEVMGTYRKKGR